MFIECDLKVYQLGKGIPCLTITTVDILLHSFWEGMHQIGIQDVTSLHSNGSFTHFFKILVKIELSGWKSLQTVVG